MPPSAFDQALDAPIGSDAPEGDTRAAFEALSPFTRSVVQMLFQCGVHPRQTVHPLASGRAFCVQVLDVRLFVSKANFSTMSRFLEEHDAEVKSICAGPAHVVLFMLQDQRD